MKDESDVISSITHVLSLRLPATSYYASERTGGGARMSMGMYDHRHPSHTPRDVNVLRRFCLAVLPCSRRLAQATGSTPYSPTAACD